MPTLPDAVRVVIDAVHAHSPNLSQIASDALREIDSQIEHLTTDRDLIRQLASRFADSTVPANGQVVAPQPTSNGSGGLSVPQKERVNKIIDDYLSVDSTMDTQVIVNSLVEQLGDIGALNLAQPRSALGTMVHFRRERLKRAMAATLNTAYAATHPPE